MSAENTRAVPADVERVRQRIELWRQQRTPGKPMPQRLWAAAAKVAQRHGVARTMHMLGVDYYKLKSLAQGAAPVESAQFVEVAPPAPVGQCRIEIEGRAGARIKIELPAASSADLVLGLCQRVWGDAR
jgi:hypothetical protein